MNIENSPAKRLEAIVEDFEFLDDWEEKFRHIIDLGKALAPLQDADKNAQNKVQGCTSQVWIISEYDKNSNLIRFSGNSDSTLVQGLLAILISIYSNASPKQILELDPNIIFQSLQLADSLTPNRSGGMTAMVNRMQDFAKTCAQI